MNCHDTRSLSDPYLDSELDVKTSLEIQQHLTACPECARWVEVERSAASRLDAALQRGELTPALWDRAEQIVRGAGRMEPEAPTAYAEPWWREWLWPSPRFYAGLAGVWVMMLTFHLVTLGGSGAGVRAVASPSPEAMRVLAEQRRDLALLLGHDGAALVAPAGRPEQPRPQSGRPRPGGEPGHANRPTPVSDAPRA